MSQNHYGYGHRGGGGPPPVGMKRIKCERSHEMQNAAVAADEKRMRFYK